ncbi:GNAT family N-acetyltransferase [Sphingobacterium endophyticum]|uniref:GNAT family N-acetyltransferase n=1 Tax=Sphingobacterium endophyticum TaxID=2546448 RepID=UPI0012E1BC04|nr:GNAT family N-acetyltransferase [Sphingobacterium endophyticum]
MQEIDQIKLVKTELKDLERLFEFQKQKEGIYLAAFTASDPGDKEAYLSKFERILKDPKIQNYTIFLNNIIVGSIAKFPLDGKIEITYWIDRDLWGKGIASKSLAKLIEMDSDRPIYGRVAFDNLASQKVLKKCGFIRIAEDKGFANARQKEIVEYIYQLS